MISYFFSIPIRIFDGVYAPSDDTFMIMENVKCSGKTIEIGCGTALISIYFRKRGCDIECTDINNKAVECAIDNAKLNEINLRVYQSDLFDKVGNTYDTIIFNPPYLPVEDEDPAWTGGKTGLEISDRFLIQAYRFLNKGGHIYMILSDLTDTAGFISKHAEYKFNEIARKTFDFESIILYEIEKKDS
ncbi:MAG: HemK2/MTQ2 family protein methyltransferase [Thermoplasmata archaeon]